MSNNKSRSPTVVVKSIFLLLIAVLLLVPTPVNALESEHLASFKFSVISENAEADIKIEQTSGPTIVLPEDIKTVDGKVEIELNFDKLENYEFTVKLTNEDNKMIDFDNTLWRIKVAVVTDDDSNISAIGQIFIDGNDEKADVIKFQNKILEQPVAIKKVNDNGNPLPGAHLYISKNGEKIMEWTSGNAEEVLKLLPGDYTIGEISAPSGFNKAPEAEITVEKDGKISLHKADERYYKIENNVLLVTNKATPRINTGEVRNLLIPIALLSVASLSLLAIIAKRRLRSAGK